VFEKKCATAQKLCNVAEYLPDIRVSQANISQICRSTNTGVTGPRMSQLEVVFVQRHHHHHHWSSVVHGCRLSATELFRWLLFPSPTSTPCLERTTTARHDCTVPTEFSGSRPKTDLFSRSFPDFMYCLQSGWLLSLSDT